MNLRSRSFGLRFKLILPLISGALLALLGLKLILQPQWAEQALLNEQAHHQAILAALSSNWSTQLLARDYSALYDDIETQLQKNNNA